MKKNYLFGLLSLFSVLFMASCQEEDVYGGASDANTGVVTFKVNTQQVGTRAATGEGQLADSLYYGVYENINDKWQLVKAISKITPNSAQPISLDGTVVSIRLAKQKQYSVIFWAQSDSTMFTVDWANHKIDVKSPIYANAEGYDAFWACDTVTINGALAKEINLVRPFAQLNIGISDADLKAAQDASVNVVSSSVIVKGVPTSMNLMGGTVEEASVDNADDAVTYSLNAIPAHADWTFPVSGYKYLALNYVLVGNDKSLTNVELTYKDDEGLVYSNKFTDVPVRRNYRTNVYGDLLTNEADYTIDINAAWSTPDENVEIVEVGTATDLQETIDNMQEGDSLTIVLTDDIDLSDLFNSANNAPARTRANTEKSALLKLENGRTLILDLNGLNITDKDTKLSGNYALIENRGTLTIRDSKSTGAITLIAENNRAFNNYSSVISNNPGGNLTIEGGVIEHLGGTDMAYGIDNLTNGKGTSAVTTINGGTVKSPYRAIRQFLNGVEATNTLIVNGGTVEGANKSIWMQDPNKNANTGRLTVGENAQLKGDVYLFVTEGSSEWPVEVSIAKAALQGESTVVSGNVPYNYSVVEGEDTWTVEEYFTFGAFVEAVIAAEGTYDGKGVEVKIKPASGQTDKTNSCLVPDRLQKYGNPDVYYAQYQRFAELEDINISNVTFTFIPAAVTVKDAWNTNGATTTEENINGELQFMNTGSVTLTNCTFNKVAVSPISAPALSVTGCEFNDLMAYAIKDVKATAVTISDNNFNNCNGGFWFNAAPETLTVTQNTFTEVGRRGAMQFSAAGDYTNTKMTVTGNKVEGDGALLWQLNQTVSYAQINAILNEGDNEYTTAYVDGSIKFVAKIGDAGYTTLQAAVNAVEDDETITLINDEVFTENNFYDNQGWYEGLFYDGDKSFTIDLNGKTISNDNTKVNDYLLYFRNRGENNKENVITIKNGTIDAGTSAYAAIVTASTNEQNKKITMNLESVTIIGNNSNGAVIKYRGGGELNVKAGTVITGKDNYCGIEAVGDNTVVNIYDGVQINQNGTTSYVGAIAGVNYNATLNVFGGMGKSAKCGLIVMTSGGTLNVSGGEWTANSDGTPKHDNFGVLVSQFDNATYPDAISSVINVTDGTFRGGYNCYGNVAGKASINITGGNFNADPSNYVDSEYAVTSSNDIYTPIRKSDDLIALESLIAKGQALDKDYTIEYPVTIKSGEVVVDLNGKTITATSTSAFEVATGGKLILKNGNVTAHEALVRAIGGEVVIESGEYVQTGAAVGSTPITYRYAIDAREGGKITINGGKFTSGNGMINVSANSEMTINDGQFTNIVEKTMTRHFAYVSSKLTINGGEFYGKANSSAGGCFFCGAASGCDIQIAGGKFTSLWNSGSANNIFEVYYGGTINVTGGMFNTNKGIASFVTTNTDEATKSAYPYVAK